MRRAHRAVDVWARLSLPFYAIAECSRKERTMTIKTGNGPSRLAPPLTDTGDGPAASPRSPAAAQPCRRGAMTPAVRRLHDDVPLQRAFERLTQLGSRVVGQLMAEAFDANGVVPSDLDRAIDWALRLDAAVLTAVGGDRFPRPALREVPR